MFEGSELSDGFPGVARHVADDVFLDGVTLLTHFQLCPVLWIATKQEDAVTIDKAG